MLTLSSFCQPHNPVFHGILPVWCWGAAYLALAITAIIDARRGIVPDWALLLASLLLVPAIIIGFPPAKAVLRIVYAIGFAATVWAVNATYVRIKGHDALGMGDAKWSSVAILAFGIRATLMAWAIGAWLALGWLALARSRGKPVTVVYFAPFLLAGLTAALLAIRFNCG